MILARSPYYIISDSYINDVNLTVFDIQLRIWKGDKTADKPSTPTVNFQVKRASNDQTRLFKDISPHIRDFFLNEELEKFTTSQTNQDNVVWVEWIGVHTGDTENTSNIYGIDFAVDGYSEYLEGINNDNHLVLIDMLSSDVRSTKKMLDTGITIIPVLRGFDYELSDSNGVFSAITPSASDVAKDQVFYIVVDNSLRSDFIVVNKIDGLTFEYIGKFELVCENKFEPHNVIFKNKYGVYENIYFFKKPVKSVSLDRSEFAQNLRGGISFSQETTRSLDYKTNKHQFKNLASQGKESITMMTGYVSDLMNENVKQLMFSENIYIQKDNQIFPVNIKTQTLEFQTQLVDQKVNYEIEFEYSYNQINSL